MRARSGLFVLVLPLLLSGCGVFDITSSSEEDSSSESDVSSENTSSDTTSKEDSSTTSASTSEETTPIDNSYIDYDLNTSKLTTRQFPIGNYGDYMEFVDDNGEDLTAKYNELITEVKGETNGYFKTNYEQGLLDLFDYTKKIQIKVNISKEQLRLLEFDYEVGNDESYRMCDLDIYIDNLHFFFRQVGIRQKGNTSRGTIYDQEGTLNLRHYKLSFEETFDDEYVSKKAKWWSSEAYLYRQDRKFFGEDKINLRWNRNYDTTYIREHYVSTMARANNVLAAKTNVFNMKMNVEGEEYNLGVYTLLEQFDKGFIKRNFIKSERGGDLYKLSWGYGVPATFEDYTVSEVGIDELKKYGENNFSSTLYTYSLKTNKDTSDFSVMKNFISNISEQHGNTMYDFMSTYSNLDNFVSFAAMSYLMGDPDDLRGNYNNTYVYFTGATNQIIFMPTDIDRPFGCTGGPGSNPTGNKNATTTPFAYHTGYGTGDGWSKSNLFNKAIFSSNSTEIRELYLNRIEEIVSSDWMKASHYEEMYNYAYNFYNDVAKISDNVTGNYVNFSLTESKEISGDNNLDVATYMESKIIASRS